MMSPELAELIAVRSDVNSEGTCSVADQEVPGVDAAAQATIHMQMLIAGPANVQAILVIRKQQGTAPKAPIVGRE